MRIGWKLVRNEDVDHSKTWKWTRVHWNSLSKDLTIVKVKYGNIARWLLNVLKWIKWPEDLARSGEKYFYHINYFECFDQTQYFEYFNQLTKFTLTPWLNHQHPPGPLSAFLYVTWKWRELSCNLLFEFCKLMNLRNYVLLNWMCSTCYCAQ